MSDRPVVCSRQFQTERDGVAVPIVVVWRAPEEVSDGEWNCDFEIVIDGALHHRFHGSGVDSAQALYISMMMAASRLYTFETPVFWFDPDDDLGLPTAEAMDELKAERAQRRLSKNG